MMKISLLMVACFLALIISGCTGIYQETPVAPAAVNMELKRGDYKILKTVSGSSYTKFYCCGLVKSVDGHSVVFGIKGFDDKIANINGKFLSSDTAGRAYYNALAQTPDADFVLPKTCNESTTGCILFYSKDTVEYVGKAIKLKTDEEISK